MIILAAMAVLLAAGFHAAGRPLPKWVTAGMLAGLTLAWSLMLTEFGLKVLFGRTLPTAYLQTGQYGFHWFHDGQRFGSFPSGHTDQAAAILSILWVFYPRWRWAYAGALLVLVLALVAGEWHFLSDTIAGGFVGAASGALTIKIWNAVASRRSNAPA